MNEELCNWYLARLRKLSWQDESRSKATPMTLVETDKSVLQDMVLRFSETREQRRAVFLSQLEKKFADRHLPSLLTVAALGLLLIALATLY